MMSIVWLFAFLLFTFSLSRVAISHGNDPHAMVFEALDLLGAADLVKPDDVVVLKPNYVEPMRPDTGVTTDPRVIAAVIAWLQYQGARNITICEGGATLERTARAFQMVGLPELAARMGVRLVNAFQDETEEVVIPRALSLQRVRLSSTIYNATCLINLPKLKRHSMAGVTLGVKNLMGAVIPDHEIIHRELSKRLSDLATILRPKLTIIDGLIGSERHETAGNPVKTDVIIAGADIVATDTIGCLVMGQDPEEIDHLRLCAARGLGEGDLARIEVVGAAVAEVRKKYRSGGQW
jgi:uncharacterized protein (DUF362 family)